MGIRNLFLRAEPSQLDGIQDISDTDLQELTYNQLLGLALGQLLEMLGSGDKALIAELYQRAGGGR